MSVKSTELMSFRAIARELGISEVRVSQLYASALEKLGHSDLLKYLDED